MNDEFNELYDIISFDKKEIKDLKDNYEKNLCTLMSRVRKYKINDLNLSKDYDLENNFDEYKIDEVFTNYNLSNDVIDFKISVLQRYLQDLFVEKKFLKYKKEQEEKMSKSEYLEYTHNNNVKIDKITYWYNDFLNK